MDNNIKKLIEESQKKLTTISKETGIAYPTLSGYNQGIRTPKKKNAQILADYFGVSIPYLLGLDDTRTLVNPGSPKEILKGLAKTLKGQSTIENKITEWTPFGDDLAVILADINQSEKLADYIDFIASKKKYNPVLIKAIKQFIADKEEGIIPFIINKSSSKDSPYHYVWEEWENSKEYRDRRKAKKD